MSAAQGAVDRELALVNVGGDTELLREIVDVFLDELPGSVESIHDGIESGDAIALRDAAHKLKGSLAVFGAHSAVEHALQLESMGRGGDITTAPETFAFLIEELDRLEPELRALAEE